MKAHEPDGSGDFDAFHRIRRPDGSTRWIHTRARTTFGLVNGRREPLLTTGSIMDMTERQELRLALERNEERLTQATIASEVGICEVNHRPELGERSTFWSETLRNLLGVTEGSTSELEWFFSRVHEDDRQKVAHAYRDSIDPKLRARYEIEHRFLTVEGRKLWLSARATTSFDDEGDVPAPLRTTGAILDVTERKIAEEDRRRRTAILDASPDFVAMTDLDRNLVYLNRSGREFLGIGSSEDLEERTMDEAHPPDSSRLIEEVGLPTARKKGSWTAETEFIRHDGVVVPMSQVIQVHRDESGQEVYYSTVSRDLSRERELEQQFRQAQKMDAVGRLAGGVAHDFNNLLSVIMGFAEIAGNRVQKGMSAQKELLEIQKAAGRAAALTGQLLAFSRKQILSPQAIDVNETVVGTMPMLKRLLGENIELLIEPARYAAQTKADPHQVEQVLMNLAVNARDAMPGGGRLSIAVSRVRLEQPTDLARLDLEKGRYVVIVVSDSGHGMNAQTREKIFEPFFTTKEQGKGTGLGLSTVFGIVRQSGGGISVSSEPDQGTSFRVYFPSTDERVQELPPPGPLRSEPVGAVILVTEDEAQLRRMVVLVLTQAGYTVIGAGDPEEALRLSRQHEGDIDLLLTDVVMPIMSGKDLADRLVKERPTTQVIFMSGYTEDSIVEHGVLDESVNFIPKPITPQVLLSAVGNVLRKVTVDQ
jgi:PAS domain S-box-containing protein